MTPFRETLLRSADNLEMMAREYQRQAEDPDNTQYWRERDRLSAMQLKDTVEFYRQWAEREAQ